MAERKSVQFTVPISPRLMAEIRRLSEKFQLTAAEIARRCLTEGVSKWR